MTSKHHETWRVIQFGIIAIPTTEDDREILKLSQRAEASTWRERYLKLRKQHVRALWLIGLLWLALCAVGSLVWRLHR